MDLARRRNVGYVYFTELGLPNPYGKLATHLQTQVANLVRGNAPANKVTPQTPAPQPPSSGSSKSGACPVNAFDCSGASPSSQQPLIPGTHCCCSWGMKLQSNGACR